MLTSKELKERRKARLRFVLAKKAGLRPRLSVFRSNKHIYAQVIDDESGTTVAAASSVDADFKGKFASGANRDAASAVGKMVAERALAKGVSGVVFDRGPYIYHGRVRALADGAREAGLSF